jgi:hypothetical protein
MSTVARCLALACMLVGFATPIAAADVIFVRCQFTVAQAFSYDIGGVKYAGSRMNADGCETNLPSAAITLGVDIQVGYGTQDGGATDVFRNHYSGVIDVQNGGSYSLTFPNNDQLIPLKPGVYTVSGSATSSIEGFEHPKFIKTQVATWGVTWGSLPRFG